MKEFFKANYLLFTKIILTIYTLYSLKYLFKLKHIESEFYMNITFLFIITAVYLLINYTVNTLKNGVDKRLLIISILMGLYFAFTAILGAYYEGETKGIGYAEVLDFTFNNFIISLKYIPSLWFLFLGGILFIYIQIPKIYNNYINQNSYFTEMPTMFNKFYKIWLFIFICWLPYFILLYPGYIAYDATIQIEQLFSGKFFNHHPVFTTLYMYFIPIYYKISNNGILSFALYVIFFQMLPLSFIYAYMINKLNNFYNINKVVVVFLILFFALYPINPIVSIIIEKGILFLILLILFLVKIIEVVENRELLKNKKYIIQFIIIGAILCLTRNNIIYGLIFSMFLMLIFSAEYRKNILLIFIGIFVVFLLFNGIILKSTGAAKGEFRESMSMPIQQLARVYKYHKNTLDDKEIKFIEKMMHNKEALKNYRPKLSDYVKNNTVSSFFKTTEFITGYVKLGIKYPGTYLNSFLIMSSSLWNPFENSFWLEGISMITRDIPVMNLKYDDYIRDKNQFLHQYISKTQSFINKNNSMLSFVLVNQSFLFYFFILTFIYFIYKKLYKYNFILLIPLGYIATLLLGPIIYFRYTYFFAALIPMLVMMLTNRNNSEIISNNSEK